MLGLGSSLTQGSFVSSESLLSFGTLTITGSATPDEDTATAYSIAISPTVSGVAYSWSVSPTATISNSTVSNPNITFPDPSTSYTVSCTVSKTGYANKTQTLSVTTAAGGETLIDSYDFNDDTGSLAASSATGPSGWAVSGNGNFTLYGSTVNDNFSSSQGWVFDNEGSVSSLTGTQNSHAGGPDSVGTVITSGAHSTATDGSERHMLYEATNASSEQSVRRHVIRTNELDFSGYTTITMTFWFHAYGEAFGSNYGAGIAATTSATSASSADEAGTGLGFTSDTAGGATIEYTDSGGTAQSVVRIGDGGQTHASNSAEWIKATVDLSNAAGESSVYIHFGMFTNPTGTGTNEFRQDLCIDSVAIIGS